MNEALINNIKKTFDALNVEIPKVDSNLIEIEIKKDSDRINPSPFLMAYAYNSIPEIPWFYNEEVKIESPMNKFFGFYALRNVIRGVLLATSYLEAGNILLNTKKGKFFSQCIILFYTASFHLLYSFLALEGRVIIEPVKGSIKIEINDKVSGIKHKRLKKHPSSLMGILSKSNKWVFENRNLSHKKKWGELYQIFNERNYQVPEYFKIFFEYISSYGPGSFVGEEDDFLKFCLERIANIRHEALYTVYGCDDFAHDALINRDYFVGGIDNKVEEFRKFTTKFFNEILDKCIILINSINIQDRIRSHLLSSINTPPFDFYIPEKLDSGDTEKKLIFFYDWLLRDVLKKSDSKH